MNKKIVIATSGHFPFDERIFHKFGRTFINNSYQVDIICSTCENHSCTESINLHCFYGNNLSKKDKIFKFYELIEEIKPDIIICCEPIIIIPANKYKKEFNKNVKIISDITEWYPGHSVLKQPGIKKYFDFAAQFIFNIYVSNLANKLIIGESAKKKRYDVIAPFKKKAMIGYYPVLEYFHYNPPPFNGNTLTLGYAGLITFERGILTLLDTALRLAEMFKELNFILKIIGRFQNPEEEKVFLDKTKNITSVKIEMVEWGDYRDISAKLSNVDICFDLRYPTFIYRNSLPIKIFEYMACGKPVIYTDVKVIRNELQVEKFGFLVNPYNIDEIIKCIAKYIQEPVLLQKHSKEARRLIELYYNWQNLEKRLLDFIEN